MAFQKFLMTLATAAYAQAALPQMGWNNYNAFMCEISEDLLLDSADVIASSGLRDLGYEYIVLDDCWSTKRGSDNVIQVDKKKFPNGMKSMADKLHDQGFKYGMYSSAGTNTCAGSYPGSLGHEDTDAKTFASWGVDYLKYDNCKNQGLFGTPMTSFKRYKRMSDALSRVDRDIFYSLCNWGQDASYTWGADIANSWRISGDIGPSFNAYTDKCPCDDVDYFRCPTTGGSCSVMNILNKYALITSWGANSSLNGFKGLGAFADLDMLEVGNKGMSDDENKVHFSMWAAAKSPLLMGNDVRNMSADTFTILANPAVIAVSQDPLGFPAYRVWRQFTSNKHLDGVQGELQLWTGELYNGDQLVALINADTNGQTMRATLQEIFYHNDKGMISDKASKSWDIYDLWGNRMSNSDAQSILNDKKLGTAEKLIQFNATHVSYEDGLKNNDEALMGKKIGSVKAGGHVEAKVPKHGIAFYRLRQT